MGLVVEVLVVVLAAAGEGVGKFYLFNILWYNYFIVLNFFERKNIMSKGLSREGESGFPLHAATEKKKPIEPILEMLAKRDTGEDTRSTSDEAVADLNKRLTKLHEEKFGKQEKPEEPIIQKLKRTDKEFHQSENPAEADRDELVSQLHEARLRLRGELPLDERIKLEEQVKKMDLAAVNLSKESRLRQMELATGAIGGDKTNATLAEANRKLSELYDENGVETDPRLGVHTPFDGGATGVRARYREAVTADMLVQPDRNPELLKSAEELTRLLPKADQEKLAKYRRQTSGWTADGKPTVGEIRPDRVLTTELSQLELANLRVFLEGLHADVLLKKREGFANEIVADQKKRADEWAELSVDARYRRDSGQMSVEERRFRNELADRKRISRSANLDYNDYVDRPEELPENILETDNKIIILSEELRQALETKNITPDALRDRLVELAVLMRHREAQNARRESTLGKRAAKWLGKFVGRGN